MSELLLLDESLSEEQLDDLLTLRTSAYGLKLTINDLLDYSRIEAGKLSVAEQPFNLARIIEETGKILKVETKNNEQIFICYIDENVPEYVRGDEHRIQQILTNLIGNAIKFTSRGGGIVVQLQVLEESEDEVAVSLSVADTGIGIPAEALKKIFAPFTQASESTTRRFGGTGLGLAIVKRLVELMHGSISIQSKEEVGTAIEIIFTFRKEDSLIGIEEKPLVPLDLPEKIPTAADVTQKILIVEDNDINRTTLERFLARSGYEVLAAEGGPQALSLLKNETVDLILMDLHMPDMGGVEVTRRIRESDTPAKEVPIIAVTADAVHGRKEYCLDSGMNGFITKPIDYPALFSEIETHLGSGGVD